MNTIDKGICRGCQRPILWIKNEHGKAEPFDAKPTRMLQVAGDVDPDGTTRAFIEPDRKFEVKTGHINHFVTCPVANRFREKGKETHP